MGGAEGDGEREEKKGLKNKRAEEKSISEIRKILYILVGKTYKM